METTPACRAGSYCRRTPYATRPCLLFSSQLVSFSYPGLFPVTTSNMNVLPTTPKIPHQPPCSQLDPILYAFPHKLPPCVYLYYYRYFLCEILWRQETNPMPACAWFAGWFGFLAWTCVSCDYISFPKQSRLVGLCALPNPTHYFAPQTTSFFLVSLKTLPHALANRPQAVPHASSPACAVTLDFPRQF